MLYLKIGKLACYLRLGRKPLDLIARHSPWLSINCASPHIFTLATVNTLYGLTEVTTVFFHHFLKELQELLWLCSYAVAQSLINHRVMVTIMSCNTFLLLKMCHFFRETTVESVETTRPNSAHVKMFLCGYLPQLRQITINEMRKIKLSDSHFKSDSLKTGANASIIGLPRSHATLT